MCSIANQFLSPNKQRRAFQRQHSPAKYQLQYYKSLNITPDNDIPTTNFEPNSHHIGRILTFRLPIFWGICKKPTNNNI